MNRISALAFVVVSSCVSNNGEYAKVVDLTMEVSQSHYEILPGKIRGLLWIHGALPKHAQNEDAQKERSQWVKDGLYRKAFLLEYWGEPDQRKTEGGVDYLIYTGLNPANGEGLKSHLSPDRPIVLGYEGGSLCYVSAYFKNDRGMVPDVKEWVVP